MTDTACHVFWSRFTLNWLSSVAVLQCVFSASFLVECSVQDIVRGLFRGAADLI